MPDAAPHAATSTGSPRWWLILALVGMCAGVGVQGLRHGGNVLTSALFMDLRWSEPAAILTVQAGSVILLAAAVLLATRWWRVAAAYVALWMAALAFARAHQAEIAPFCVPVEQAVRFLAPIALLGWPAGAAPARGVVSVLTVAAAATFAGHGLECLRHHGVFLDYLFHVSDLAGAPFDEPAAKAVLVGIGVVDLVVAGLLLAVRSPWVAAWMALWGFATAGVRIVHGGASNYTETLLRLPNGGVPLVLALLWLQRRRV